MSLTETSRYCYTCKKVFCCVECRERHEQKKHSNRQANCPLCCSQKLPLHVFEDKTLFCHIVINHLPLYCCLCGQLFKESKDLQTFGACKWWKFRHYHSLVAEKPPQPETPPPILDIKGPENSTIDKEGGKGFTSLTSPPVLYRNTSTPMVVGQKTVFDFKTPNTSAFSLKTPKLSSAAAALKLSDNNRTYSTSKDSNSNFMSFSVCISNQNNTSIQALSLANSNRLNSTENFDKKDENEPLHHGADNYYVEDMELTGVEQNIPIDSPSLATTDVVKPGKRSDVVKRVRFSNQFDQDTSSSSPTSTLNMTENEEYFEACDTMPEGRRSCGKTEVYQEILDNEGKENFNPKSAQENVLPQSSGSSRVLMMLVMENDSKLTTSNIVPLIESGLKQLNSISNNSSPLANSITNVPKYSNPESNKCTVSSMESFSSVSNYECFKSSGVVGSSTQIMSGSSENIPPSNSGGIFSAMAHAVRTVVKNITGGGMAKTISRQVSQEMVIASSTVETSRSSTILHRSAKRPRDISEPSTSMTSSRDQDTAQVEPRSPLPKRYRGWSNIKGREPISRMRARTLTSPRGISSETQVFSQGSLSVGHTILPLPARAHQSTQTEKR